MEPTVPGCAKLGHCISYPRGHFLTIPSPQDLFQRSHHSGRTSQFLGSSHLLFPASPLLPGPRSRPDLPAATSCSSNTVQKGLNAGEQQLHAVNPGFSAPIPVPVICISLLCASFSSSPSVARAPALAYGARRGLRAAGIPLRASLRHLQAPSIFQHFSHFSFQSGPCGSPLNTFLCRPAGELARQGLSHPSPTLPCTPSLVEALTVINHSINPGQA